MAIKVTEERGRLIVEGECSLEKALSSIVAHFDRKASIQIKLGKIAREQNDTTSQAIAEVRAREAIDKMKLFASASEDLPPSKRRSVERIDSIGDVRLEEK